MRLSRACLVAGAALALGADASALGVADLDRLLPGDHWVALPQSLGELPSWRLDALQEIRTSSFNAQGYAVRTQGAAVAVGLEPLGGFAYDFRSAELSDISPALGFPPLTMRFDTVGWGKRLGEHLSLGLTAGRSTPSNGAVVPETVGSAGVGLRASEHELDLVGSRSDWGYAMGMIEANGPLLWTQGYWVKAIGSDRGYRELRGGLDVRRGFGVLALYDGGGHWSWGLGWVREPSRPEAVRFRVKAA